MLERLTTGSRRVSRWCVIAFGITIPVWTLADGILIALLIPAWLGTGDWAGKLRRIQDSPVALSVVGFVGLLALGTLWGLGGVEDRALAFKRYSELLFVPLLISLTVSAKDKERALLALAASLTVTLLMSFCMAWGFLPTKGLLKGGPSNPYIFKKHTTHNVLMAFGCLLFAIQSLGARESRWRWIWGGCAALAAVNIIAMVQGRTGYAVLAALACLALFKKVRWKGVLIGFAMVGVATAAFYMSVPTFTQRVDLTVSGVLEWNPGTVARDPIGERLEFSRHTIDIIQAHPLLGVGTGGFVAAYTEQVKGTSFPVPAHPHNQYLLVTAQLGVVGLAAMLWLFVQQWRWSFRLSNETHGLLARGLVATIAIGCLFNTFLIDHTEKLFSAWMAGVLFSPSVSQREGIAS